MPFVFVTPEHDFSARFDGDSYNLVLSPHYYWCQQSDRHFKTPSQARKFASSMFEFNKDYEYDVYKMHEKYYFVAFNTESIREKLLSQGVDLSKINSIYAAQAFFDDFPTPIRINKNQAMTRIDGVLVAVNQEFCTQLDEEHELKDFAKEKLYTLKFSGLRSQSSANLILPAAITGVAASLWLILSLVNSSITGSELSQKQDDLKVKYELPSTSFQLKSMLKRLEKVDKRQKFIREILHILAEYKAYLGAQVSHINADSKHLKVTLSTPLQVDNETRLSKAFKLYHFTVDANKNGFEVRP